MKLVLLDVYGTLLNMETVERKVNQVLGSKRGYLYWFELFMQYCFVDNCIAQFNKFEAIAKATMQMAAHSLHTTLDEDEINEVFDLLKQLPVNPGVEKGLSKLNDLNVRVAALTNSPEQTVTERMERTGLISFFEKVLSAEHVGKYKPDINVYNWAATQLGLQPKEILMVSVHGWDLAGAGNAGMQTAYLEQSNHMLYPLSPKPDFVCKSLTDLAGQISDLYDQKIVAAT